ncbi:hypothetical protein BDV96DRAFT_579016 [Lophiotrema nucula]|uniref:Uncharacterized protein n=1 Tax=Lophiotrema nucula TaxID=690887 RepID=A0A6A5Z1U9_9PLEO|nr:hypothetical protein BDV96DRAFT_579016 [Lophiotrema nucula]
MDDAPEHIQFPFAANVSRPRTRRATAFEAGHEVPDKQSDATDKQRAPNTTFFRFLDLPAELQNRIYEIAAGDAARTWPLRLEPTLPLKPTRRTRGSAKTSTRRPPLTYPYLGLTQTCAKIRSDFRGWWMEGHRIRLGEIERYMSVFWRHPPRKDRHRFEAYFNRAGNLRIQVLEADLAKANLLSLVKLKIKLPNYNITFEPSPLTPAEQIEGLNQFINNKHPQWRKWIRANAITSVRPVTGGNTPRIYLVFSLKYAQDWMRPTLYHRVPEGFLESAGLDTMTYWSFGFGVKYD